MQLLIDLLLSPDEAFTVLRHFESGGSDTASVHGLRGRDDDTGLCQEELKGVVGSRHISDFDIILDAVGCDLLSVFHMEELAGHVAENLPYGQQRKLEIARALATNPKVLLLDEPAAGMNPTETAELMQAISLIRERFGIAILLIEHDMSLVMNVCERIVVIDYGQIIAHGTPKEIANNPRVIGAYLGE